MRERSEHTHFSQDSVQSLGSRVSVSAIQQWLQISQSTAPVTISDVYCALTVCHFLRLLQELTLFLRHYLLRYLRGRVPSHLAMESLPYYIYLYLQSILSTISNFSKYLIHTDSQSMWCSQISGLVHCVANISHCNKCIRLVRPQPGFGCGIHDTIFHAKSELQQ